MNLARILYVCLAAKYSWRLDTRTVEGIELQFHVLVNSPDTKP
jgi:hypothetical protein